MTRRRCGTGWRSSLLRISLVLAVCATGPLSFAGTIPVHAAGAAATQTRLGFAAGDDWEPAIASDRQGHTYALFKHYDVPPAISCPGCDLHLLLQRSSDKGATWTAPRPIAPGRVVGGQFDPQIVVDPIDGRTVWASFLQGSNSLIGVVHSDDDGVTWTKPMLVSSRPPGLDKDILAVRGDTVAVAYDDNRDTWATVSHDRGRSWSTHLVAHHDFRHWISLGAGGGIDSHGNMFFSWDSFDRTHEPLGDGPVTLWVSRSTDGGVHWTRRDIDTTGPPMPCDPCGYAYFSSQMALRVGADDAVDLLWNGSHDLTRPAPARIFFSNSTDAGSHWSSPRGVSDAPQGVEHSFPALAEGTRPGDLRVGWMDQRTGAWNVFLRTSSDGGRTFEDTKRLSGYVPGYAYLSPQGFTLPYGDYFQLAVGADGATLAAFGEGPNYAGPGNIWFRRIGAGSG